MRRIKQTALALLATSAFLVLGCGGGDAGPAGARGAQGEQGTQGEPGMPGTPGLNDPTINAVNPPIGFLNRNISVTIGGNDTAWGDGTTVDFGAGIQAKVVSANPGLLLVDLTIDEGAALGPRDVIVSGGADGAMLTLKGVFQVAAPIEVGDIQGTLAQGSIFVARAKQKDISTPFDTSGSGKNVSVTLGPGLEASIDEVETYTIDFNGHVDVDTPPGDFDLRVASGLASESLSSIAPKAGTVAARAPKPLVEGVQSPDSVATPFESYLYSFAPGPHKLVSIDVGAADSGTSPNFALLPESGKFADLISFGPSGRLLTTSDKPVYVIYWDNSGASGYPFDIYVTTQDSGDLEPNDTCATAQALGSPSNSLVNLSLRDQSDEDWFVLTTVAADIGKIVHTVTKPGDEKTDTYVEVFKGTCANLVPMGAPSEDKNYHEDHSSGSISAAGKVYVKVSNSPSSSFKGSFYDLDIEMLRSEVEPNNLCNQANAITALPADLKFASLGGDADADWYAVTVSAANVGKLLDITTWAGDENTDTYIEVYSGNCASPALIAKSPDKDYLDTLQVGPIAAAGTYFVRISNSPTYPYAGAKYNVSFSAVIPPDIEPNDLCTQAQPGGALGSTVGPLELSSQADVDWHIFPASAADVGKSVHVVTSPGDSNTDTVVEVFDGTCAALNPLGGASTDIFYHEDHLSAPITQPGFVYVKISNSPVAYVDSAYMLTVTYE